VSDESQGGRSSRSQVYSCLDVQLLMAWSRGVTQPDMEGSKGQDGELALGKYLKLRAGAS
jgi:hypothetical protein